MSLDEKPTPDFATTLAKLEVVARIMYDLASDGERVSDMWENYPEIGENDWIDICQMVLAAVSNKVPTQEQFDRAYRHLASRVDQS